VKVFIKNIVIYNEGTFWALQHITTKILYDFHVFSRTLISCLYIKQLFHLFKDFYYQEYDDKSISQTEGSKKYPDILSLRLYNHPSFPGKL